MKPVYIFLAEGSEEIESLTIVDVLRRAEVPAYTVSVTGSKTVKLSHGVRVETDLLIEEAADLREAQLLVLPGGLPGSYHLADHEGLAVAIREHHAAGKPLAAICAAPLVYGRMGLLRGHKATCYPGMEQELEGAEYTGRLVEKDGLFVTGKGPAASFEFAYTLVEMTAGKEKADALRAGMLYTELNTGR